MNRPPAAVAAWEMQEYVEKPLRPQDYRMNSPVLSSDTPGQVRTMPTITNVNFNEETLRAMIDRIHEEKSRIVPGCAACASPCGNTNDYDMKQIWEADEDIRPL